MSGRVSVGKIGVFCFHLGLSLVRVRAGDLYVSTQGNDGNAGTAAQPLRTITQAYSLASAGTTVYVASGVYTDYSSGWGIHLGKSGTAGSPITLKSQVRGGAVIDGQNTADHPEGFYIDGNYNVVDGFEIRNCPNGGISIWSDGNRILNNEIHHNGNPASTSTNGKDGVYSNEGTSGNYYAANSIHDNGRTGSNLDHGLYLCGQNETVINNLLFRNAASGLQVAGYTTVSNMKVYNNVVAWNGTSGIILWMALSGVDIKNNIIYQNGHAGIGCYAATGSGVVVDHNLVYGNGYGSYDWLSGSSTV
ncbi:MAG TPA: right-handed parallel beta-helix repeat-containing protein, partial [Verrucomicrobiae bacterium]